MTALNTGEVRADNKKMVFPPELEAAFRTDRSRLNQARLFHSVGVLVVVNIFLQFINFKTLAGPPSFLLIPLPLLALLFGQKKYTQYVDGVYSVSIILSGLSIITMIVLFPENSLNFSVLTVLIISGFLLFRLGIKTACFSCFALVAAYGGAAVFIAGVPLASASTRIILLCLICLVGMSAGRIQEYYSRTLFLKNTALDQLSQKSRKEAEQKNKELVRINKSLGLEILAHAEAESQLRESEEKYRNLIDSLPEGILIVQNGKIAFMNPAIERMTGFDKYALTGKPLETVLKQKPSDSRESDALFSDFLIRRDKVKIQIEKSGVEILYNQSKALLYSIRDVTEKILARQDKEQLQAALDKARKMEALGLLAGGVAHDLNNILSGLVSIPDILLADLDSDSPLAGQVRLIKESGEQAAVIVEDLLILARGSKRAPEPVHFNHVVEDYFSSPEFACLMAEHPRVVIDTDLDPAVEFFEGSGMQIRKIVMNLVSNAVEAVGQAKGDVLVKTEWINFENESRPKNQNSPARKCICFSVRDTGAGISKQDIDRIFEPFYSRKVLGRSGTGLGLSIVWNGVRDHQGHIEVESRDGHTLFTLYFPVTAPRESGLILEPVKNDLGDVRGSGETVLVVEDRETQREITRHMLKRLGYHPVTVSTGEAALKAAASRHIDLVILDMVLETGINGLETFKELLLIDPDIKAIIVSGNAVSGEVEKAQNMGAGDCVKKPFTLEQIGLAIKKELT